MSRNHQAPPEYWTYRAETARAMSDGELSSNELQSLIVVLRNLATALGKSNLFEGKSNEEIHLWLKEGL